MGVSQANKVLFEAAENGDVQKVLEAIKEKADVDSLHESTKNTSFGKWTPLHIACVNGHQEVVIALLDSKASLTTTVGWGCHPLEVAAMYGKKEIMKILTDAGADINAVSSMGKTAAQIYVEWEANQK
jgi:hypothetical protein